MHALLDVVDVVRRPAEDLAAGQAVEVAQREAVQLVLDVAAQASNGAVDDAVEQPALGHRQDRRHDVQHEGEQQDVAQLVELDAATGYDVHPSDDVSEAVVAAGAQPRLGLGGALTGRHPTTDHAAEDDVRGHAEDAGSDDREADADRGKRDHQ